MENMSIVDVWVSQPVSSFSFLKLFPVSIHFRDLTQEKQDGNETLVCVITESNYVKLDQ